ncbi:hypothetical protein GCM10022262_09940 [Georgenia daeguensis]|uniref:Uncharacterized protein n=1 Tax=Georgenia daeguensis TaxID=908355 RepID=A0ABP8ERP9_9MICO
MSTDRLMTCQRTVTSRTFSTSLIQRDVIHAHGHMGSNQKSAVAGAVVVSVMLPSYGRAGASFLWGPAQRQAAPPGAVLE